LIKNLLVADLSKRYGTLKNGADDIMKHKWFSSINFEKLYNKAIVSPYKPSMKDEQDTSNFDIIDEDKDIPPPVPSAADPFADW
jgi:protein kinase A